MFDIAKTILGVLGVGAGLVGLLWLVLKYTAKLWEHASIRDEIELAMREFGGGPVDIYVLIRRVQMRVHKSTSVGEIPEILIQSVLEEMVEEGRLSQSARTQRGSYTVTMVSSIQ